MHESAFLGCVDLGQITMTCERLQGYEQALGGVKLAQRVYLSAMLAGLTLSMMMTCLLQYMDVDRATPRLEPRGLATSTRRGPEALAMESVWREV